MHTQTHTHTHACARLHMHTHMHTLVSQGNGTEQKIFEKRKVFREDLEELTEVEKQKQGVVPDRWSLVRERVMKIMTTL